MTKSMQISLKPGERIFLNGAVVRVDRKVTLELMNDVAFLLESHVMQVEDTTTPLRQLYFTVQAMLVDPRNADAARRLFAAQIASLSTTFETAEILDALAVVADLVRRERVFEALRLIRGLFPKEEAILKAAAAPARGPARRPLGQAVMETRL